MTDCLFCKIARREIPAALIHEDDQLVAFRDINPQAPTHVLIVPRRHVATLDDLQTGDEQVVGAMVRLAASIARAEGFARAGYRTVFNCNADGGQTVFHIHLHLLGGRPLTWPPG